MRSDSPRELLILDTGPIRELVLFRAVRRFGFESLQDDLRFIKNKDSYDRCGQFISLFNRKTTSASVVAELHHWIRTTERTGQEKLWNRVYEEFRGMNMDEEVVKLVEMDISLVARFGPVDVSLLELARRHARRDPLVLTIDSRLHSECNRAGIGVSLLYEVTS